MVVVQAATQAVPAKFLYYLAVGQAHTPLVSSESVTPSQPVHVPSAAGLNLLISVPVSCSQAQAVFN